MKKAFLLTLLTFAPYSWGALLTFQAAGSVEPGFFNVTIDGVLNNKLLCDEFVNVTAGQYNSLVVTLADVQANNLNAQSTTLRRAGVSATKTLAIYTYIAYLDGLAYAAPLATQALTAGDVVLANRWMVDGAKEGKSALIADGVGAGTGTLTTGARTLLSQAQSQVSISVDPNFKIYTSPLKSDGTRLTQELTGSGGGAVPEPVTALYLGAGLVAMGLARKSKRN